MTFALNWNYNSIMNGPEELKPLGPQIEKELERLNMEADRADMLLGIKRKAKEVVPRSHSIVEDFSNQLPFD